MRCLRRRTREVEAWIGWLSRFKLIRLRRISLSTLQMDGRRDGQRGGCGFNSLMKQKKKAKIALSFASPEKEFFFYIWGTSDGRGPVTRNRVPDREEPGKPRKDARRGRCHPLE